MVTGEYYMIELIRVPILHHLVADGLFDILCRLAARVNIYRVRPPAEYIRPTSHLESPPYACIQ